MARLLQKGDQNPLSGHRASGRVRTYTLSLSPSPQPFLKERGGLTLFEVLLTLCLLAFIASMVWPVLEGSFSNYRLRKAADQVRTQWCKARIAAMSTGYVRVFRYEVDGSKYRFYGQAVDGSFAPNNLKTTLPSNNSMESSPSENINYSQNNTDFSGTPALFDRTLPEGIAFVGSQTAVDPQAEALINNIPAAEPGWSEPFIFYPDGTTSTGQLVLKNKDGRMIGLSLRGLTGVVKVTDVIAAEVQLP